MRYIFYIQRRVNGKWVDEAWSRSRKSAEKYIIECKKAIPENNWRIEPREEKFFDGK